MEAHFLWLGSSSIALGTKMGWIFGDCDKLIEDGLDGSNIYRILCLKWLIRAAKKNIHDSFRGFAVPELGNPALLRLPVSEFFKS